MIGYSIPSKFTTLGEMSPEDKWKSVHGDKKQGDKLVNKKFLVPSYHTTLKEKPQLSFSALIDSLKRLPVKPTNVVSLKDLTSTSVESEVLRISAEKEKRDRVGCFLTQILTNTACKFSMMSETSDTQASFKCDAALIY